MNTNTLRYALLAGLMLALGGVALSGCSKAGGRLHENLRPTVEFTHAPVAPDNSNPDFYAYKVDWSGEDPDGRVDHYEYAIDPPTVVPSGARTCAQGDTCWVSTRKNEEILFFRATQADPIKPRVPPTASDFHVLVIRAVDNLGAQSPRKHREFFSFTVAPTVSILNPIPSPLLRAQVTPSVRVDWTGNDPDGQFSQKPVKYKFKMLDLGDVDNLIYLSNPDSLRRKEAATNFVGWDSTSADTQFAQFTNLTPGKSYLFVLIGIDEAGAYNPVWDLYSNILQMAAGFAASNGPRIHIFNEFIDFIYDSGGYTTDPLREIPIEIPTHVPITVNWEAFPSPGSRIQYFRWMVDGNINDNTPRSDENTDLVHWSQPSPTLPNATILPGFSDGDHRFYLETGDNNGQKSLGILKMNAVTPSFDRQLLVVDDSRLEVDKFPGPPVAPLGCPSVYTKGWPSRTEMDTFLFARGNVPWRCTWNPASGVLSPPGLLAGYAFDTLGTRLGLENPTNGVLLSRIGKYKNLIWLVDEQGALFNEGLDQRIYPVTALFSMSDRGRASTLAAYVQLGGRVWLAGGGAGYASMIHFDKRNNNRGQTTVFSSAAQFGELGPSRIMYDGAHWRSSMGITNGSIHTFRYDFTLDSIVVHPGGARDTIQLGPFPVLRKPWSHIDAYTLRTLTSPDYSKLPPEMRWRSAATDPIPPTRLASAAGAFYQSSYPSEYILDNNSIIEDTDPSPDVSHEEAVLDTLMASDGIVLLSYPNRAPTMTYYHGKQAHQFIFSGFSPWGYARNDCLALVDFVLQDIWGLPRLPIDRGSIAPFLKSRGSSPARIVTPAQRTVSARVPAGTTRE